MLMNGENWTKSSRSMSRRRNTLRGSVYSGISSAEKSAMFRSPERYRSSCSRRSRVSSVNRISAACLEIPHRRSISAAEETPQKCRTGSGASTSAAKRSASFSCAGVGALLSLTMCPERMCPSSCAAVHFRRRLMAQAGVQYAQEPPVGEQAESAPAGVGVELLPGNVVDSRELVVGDYLYPKAVRQGVNARREGFRPGRV